MSPDEILALRRQAVAGPEPSGLDDQVWRDERAATRVVDGFRRLRLKPGFRLITYGATTGIGGRGFTFAVPEDAELMPAGQAFASERGGPTPPPSALADPMEAIEGDGSLESYLEASILLRELEELGACWHGLGWSTIGVLGPSDDPGWPALCEGETVSMGADGLDDRSAWTWVDRPPEDWRPRAERPADGSVLVTFYGYTELGVCAIFRSRDEYAPGRGLVPSRSESGRVATGPGGYIF